MDTPPLVSHSKYVFKKRRASVNPAPAKSIIRIKRIEQFTRLVSLRSSRENAGRKPGESREMELIELNQHADLIASNSVSMTGMIPIHRPAHRRAARR